MNDDEKRWLKEFESLGEAEVQSRTEQNYFTVDAKRDFAHRWIKEKDKARISREIWLFRYAKWTFWAALVAVLVGIFGILVTLVH
jgi:hypothetical protein